MIKLIYKSIFDLKNKEHTANILSGLFLKLFTAAVFFVAIPFAIRKFGAQSYGIVSFFVVFQGYIILLDTGFSYGLGVLYGRSLADSSPSGSLLRMGSFFYLVIATVFGLAMFFLAPLINSISFNNIDCTSIFRIFAGISFIAVLDSYFTVLLQAHNKIYKINITRFALDLVRALGLFIGATYGSISFVIISLLLGYILKLGLSINYVRPIIPLVEISPRFSSDSFRSLLILSAPSVGVAIMTLLLSSFDKIFVSGKLSSVDFAHYSFAFDINTKVYFLLYAVSSAFYPTLVKRFHIGAPITGLISVWLWALIAVGFCYYLPMGLFSEKIIALLVSQDFAIKAAPICRAFALSSIIYLCFNFFENLLNASGRAHLCFISYLSGLFFLVVWYFSPANSNNTAVSMSHLVVGVNIVMLLVASLSFFLRRQKSIGKKIS